MDIVLEGIGKRFRYDWIFEDINLRLESGKIYGLQGPNGSGKSTLLKIISAHLSPSAGKVRYQYQGQDIPRDVIYKKVGYTAPYIELIEEFSLSEAIQFHQQFKPLLNNWSTPELLNIIQLPKTANKELANFSSGMKQRVKLALCICSQSNFLLIDEPNTNLDAQGAEWFQELLQANRQDRTVIIASNEIRDFELCDELIDIREYKR